MSVGWRAGCLAKPALLVGAAADKCQVTGTASCDVADLSVLRRRPQRRPPLPGTQRDRLAAQP